jgi:hypothetical protein
MKQEILFDWMNDYVQLVGDWGWTTWRILKLEVERDHQFDGWTLELVILGLGFYVRYNSGKDTETSDEVNKRLKELTNPTL